MNVIGNVLICSAVEATPLRSIRKQKEMMLHYVNIPNTCVYVVDGKFILLFI